MNVPIWAGIASGTQGLWRANQHWSPNMLQWPCVGLKKKSHCWYTYGIFCLYKEQKHSFERLVIVTRLTFGVSNLLHVHFHRKFWFISVRQFSQRLRQMCVLEKLNFKISRGSMPPDPLVYSRLQCSILRQWPVMLPLSRIVRQRSPWQMYTLATRSTRLFGVGHVSCCTRIKLIAGLTRFTGVVAAYTPQINACEVQQPLTDKSAITSCKVTLWPLPVGLRSSGA